MAALESGEYQYFCRLDIKSYYASIDHKILLKQINKNYDDPIILKYLKSIVTTGVDINGNIALPKEGIPLRSSLSPFFGALYLDELDREFENKKNTFYYRYMDDIILLAKTKRQYQKARKKVFGILKKLKLTLSDRKSSMGSLSKMGFHYLGVKYEVTRTSHSPISHCKGEVKTQVLVRVHPKTCRRALDRVKALRADAVNPAKIQRTLKQWSAWWHFSDDMSVKNNLTEWIAIADKEAPSLRWFGSGLLCFKNANRCNWLQRARSRMTKFNQDIIHFFHSRAQAA